MSDVTFDHHAEHPEFFRFVSVENTHGARIAAAPPSIRVRNAAVAGTFRRLIRRWGLGSGQGWMSWIRPC